LIFQFLFSDLIDSFEFTSRSETFQSISFEDAGDNFPRTPSTGRVRPSFDVAYKGALPASGERINNHNAVVI
jgi:hypothetical protein